jgi:hypothetical protein
MQSIDTKYTIALLVIGMVGAVAAGLFFFSFKVVPFADVTAGEVGTVFAGLILVALVIERATEVYVHVGVTPDPARQERIIAATAAAVDVRMSREQLAEGSLNEGVTANRLSGLRGALTRAENAHKAAVAAAATAREEERTETRKKTSFFAMVLGVVAALVGVRVIGVFILAELPSGTAFELEAVQQKLLTGIDVFLTGALLAGGADGLHHLVNRFVNLTKTPDA